MVLVVAAGSTKAVRLSRIKSSDRVIFPHVGRLTALRVLYHQNNLQTTRRLG
jgi:hypothetical protein